MTPIDGTTCPSWCQRHEYDQRLSPGVVSHVWTFLDTDKATIELNAVTGSDRFPPEVYAGIDSAGEPWRPQELIEAGIALIAAGRWLEELERQGHATIPSTA